MLRELTGPPPATDRTRTGSVLTRPTSPAIRAWGAPLWAHAAALAVLLLALASLVGSGASFSADEGAAIVQAHHLADGDGWVVDHPLPHVDPTGKAYPLELANRGDKGTAPFAKHPLYALLLAGADRVGGHAAMVLLSLAGTVLAAVLAAALGGQLRPALSRPSLWVVGLATPLLFDGYLVIAHTLGAAAAAGAVLFALRVADGRDRRWLAIAGAVASVVVAVLLRNEAVFWGLGLGVALGVFALVRRDRVLAGGAAAVSGAAGLAHLGETVWIGHILGGHAVGLGASPDAGVALLAGRVHSMVLTWLRPGYGQFPGAELVLVLMLAAVVAGTVAVRRHPGERTVIVGFAVIAGAASVVAFVAAPTNLVPGLLVAAPVVAAGLVTLGRASVGPIGARLALGTFAVFALAVAATQYVQGGAGEWGGRYFALGLPVLVPALLLALAEAGARLDRFTWQAAVGALAVCSVMTTAMGLTRLAESHRLNDQLMATAARAGRDGAAPGERPVMLATSGLMPRMAWATFDQQRWLLSDPADLGPLAARLRGAGIWRVVLVTEDPRRDLAALGAGVVAVDRLSGGERWHILQLGLR